MADIKNMAQILGTPALDGKYIAEMDMWPLECQEFNRNYKFYDHLREGRFTTTKCKKCGNVAFPPGVICPKCWSEDLEWVDLPQRAKVVAFTETIAGAPLGFDCPLIIAWLDFGKNAPLKHFLARIINSPEGKLKEGDEVKFVVFDVASHPMDVKKDTKICERVYYAFEPVSK
jgi:uncharacterized OB-fold protein